MTAIGDAIARGVLAMTGGKSPWGGGDRGKTGAAGEDSSGAPSGPEEPPAEPPAEPGAAPPAGSPAEPTRGPRNPWQPPGGVPGRRSASIEDIFKPRELRGGGGPGGGGPGGGLPRLPRRPDGRSWLPVIGGVAALVWLFFTTSHMLGPKEQGIVTTFGSYSRPVYAGVSFTFPWPIQSVDVTDVTSIRRDTIPDSEEEKLMLTSDKNLVNLSYLVRWTIKDLKLYKFRLEDPDTTVKEVAEAAMRATVAEVPLNDVIGGTGRGRIEQNVRIRMQAILDAYKAGVLVQGVELKKTDPPEKVVASFQNVNVAQQEAEKYRSQARAWAGQVLAIAQGEAAAFDKVYGQYKLAPEVTKRRMYYETMERLLRNNEKIVVEANGVTPYLPLPEVRRKAQAAAAPVPGGE